MVAANGVYLLDPEFILARDNGDNGGGDDDSDDGNGTSSTMTSATATSSGGNHHTSTTYTSSTQTSTEFTTTTTASSTLASSGSVYATGSSSSSASQNDSASSASQGLSTAARTGLSFGIMLLIFSAIFFCYIRRRSRKAREKASYEPVLLSSEVRQYSPPDPAASRERELLPPPRLNTAHQDSYEISRSCLSSAISSAALLLGDSSHTNSHSTPSWNSSSALLQATDIPQITTQQMSIFPNPHDPFPAPARSASTIASTTSSSPGSRPSDVSTLRSATVTGAFAAPGRSNSRTSHSERRLSALHTDLARHQKELELDHRKRALEAQEEPQEPPPEYSS